MATYRVRFIAAHPQRELVQNIAGCDDEYDARNKLRALFEVLLIKRVELVVKE